MAATGTGLPEFGAVKWTDACGKSGRLIKKPKRDLPVKVSVGRLFISSDGTLAVIHEYDPRGGVYQHDVEMTLIPQGWYQEIVPLLAAEAKKETDHSLHQAEPTTPVG